jgi:hypothetical protein
MRESSRIDSRIETSGLSPELDMLTGLTCSCGSAYTLIALAYSAILRGVSSPLDVEVVHWATVELKIHPRVGMARREWQQMCAVIKLRELTKRHPILCNFCLPSARAPGSALPRLQRLTTQAFLLFYINIIPTRNVRLCC